MLSSFATLMFILATFFEGVVVSDCRSQNMATCPNIAANVVDLTENLRAVYVEAEVENGGGYKYLLENPYSNNLRFGDRVKVTVIDGQPSFEVLAHNVPVPSKVKHIGDLTDRDLYTFVTLDGLEFCKKEGAYLNVNEKTVQITEINKYIAEDGALYTPAASENADAWATMLRDDKGQHIYCIINSTCTWRRDGRGVPQGVGRVSGIIVPGELDRYGNSLGKYAIRPIDAASFDFPAGDATSYADICAWRWNFNKYAEMNFVKAGAKRFVKPGEIAGDAIKAETGHGVLYTDTGASLSLDDEFDARHPFDGWKAARMTGSRSYSALRLDCTAGDFYSGSSKRGLYLETSLEGVKAETLQLYFSFAASREHSKYAENFPLHWQVQYSVDGSAFKNAGEIITLCPVIFQNIVHKGGPATVHTGCVPGFTEHSVTLPKELSGAKKLVVRIVPASDKVAVMPATFNGQWQTGNVRSVADQPVIIRFGDVVLSYLK